MKLILLRGLARESAHWGDFSSSLAASIAEVYGDHFIVETPDLLGCGIHFTEQTPLTIHELTDAVRRDLANSPHSEKGYILVGLSMGGMLALDWAQRYPQEVKALCLINSSLGNHPLHWRLKLRAWPHVIRCLWESVNARERNFLCLVSNNSEARQHHQKLWLSIQAQRPVTRATILRMLIAARRFCVHQFPHATPGLVLASRADRLVSFRCSQHIAKASKWPIVLHPSAGHDLPMDDADWTQQHIMSLLKSVTKA